MDKKGMFANIVDFSGLKITLASPDAIKAWSYGEVTKPETINYRTLKPEKDGLFDERIFGPTKDWECYCGKYKRIRYRGIVCDKCGVEVTQSKVRRERMGHINLAAPVAHVWFFKGAPSKLSLLLDISPRALEEVIYFAQYLVTSVDEEKKKAVLGKIADAGKKRLEEVDSRFKDEKATKHEEFQKEREETKDRVGTAEARELALSEIALKEKQATSALSENADKEKEKLEEITKSLETIVKSVKLLSTITEDEYLRLFEYEAAGCFRVGMGAEAILEVVRGLDLDKLAATLREEIQNTTGQRHIKATKRLRVVDGMRKAELTPTWMILSILPVIPPDLRPMVQLTGGRFATSDLNDLYRRVINRNNRLKHLMDLGAPEIILRNEKRMLQEAVDSLIDTTQRPSSRAVIQPLRSLSDMLRGKQGRFRQNLLGKRVDYSGRSVIVVGPELKLTQCGLPKEMALEMFKPFVLRELIVRGIAPNVKNAKNVLERRTPEVFDILEEITKNHPVLLNRAPTLHKLGIQAFYPILIEGAAIRIHPCVCAGYNADFDGDQMAVHIPLGGESQNEAIHLMLPTHNLLKPADGSPITVPNKEMVLGCYFLTTVDPKAEKIPQDQLKVYPDIASAIYANQIGKLALRHPVRVKSDGEWLVTTVGKMLFNEILPRELRFMNTPVKAATIKTIVTRALVHYTKEEVVTLIDAIKTLGFWGATLCGGLSVSVFDCEIIEEKQVLVTEAEEKVADIDNNYQQGLITLEEKKRLSNEVWIEATERIADLTWAKLPVNNPVKMIIESGSARASKDQLKQLSAIKGLVVDPLGKIVELPTKSNYREGLQIFEYVTSTRGSRKGLTDSALKTADAGYLTRRLVDVAHDAIIRDLDCGTDQGWEIVKDEERQAPLSLRIIGRYAAADVIEPRGKRVLIPKGEFITEELARIADEHGVESVLVRSPISCQLPVGLCIKCYGRDYSTGQMVETGTPVGVIAAQSIGEPGTQLTMRVKHAGGIVGLDVTQGLPRVEELFEVRTPRVLSPVSEIAGTVEITEGDHGHKVRVRNTLMKPVEEREYLIPLTSELRVKEDDLVGAGDQLASGALDIKEVLQIRGLRGAQKYLITEIQKVYESQGIGISDKHFEVITRKMSEKVRIDTAGDTNLLPGELVDRTRFGDENARVLAQGGEPATAQIVVLGITRASLYTESWLSAASFQETTNVLTDAALAAKEDKLLGLKENVIIGRLIPVDRDRAVIAS
ncbi:DNA-directed RNA polymerase subunit beta' [Candidatus Gottesmanbacteria bacterium RIFCSPHIGHO2_01_FULL_46_14]|uniref:DNA-directed RNA polymerase subunit beta' n=2 Tax=Candidatus Gottesmaniibacteriota TaxID=1752720 RepID=A0A1F5ZJ81_9BACT|nr:MAG: DNA-directed RNA polymerase subunit beta' [Candidatus Gottesmanbacteria bacterium RIFCSPHIGHO2_01_FULL_46_14]OGG28695.1 MAG: DNA-directed RNA polymerase subunit beta' [Candidatus Gottesmanbacteria bacterium RIFCSPLOWO2_01_FULL_46_21]